MKRLKYIIFLLFSYLQFANAQGFAEVGTTWNFVKLRIYQYGWGSCNKSGNTITGLNNINGETQKIEGKWHYKLAGDDIFKTENGWEKIIYPCGNFYKKNRAGVTIVNVSGENPHIADNGPYTYCDSIWNGAKVYYEIPAIGNKPAIRSNILTYDMRLACEGNECGKKCNEGRFITPQLRKEFDEPNFDDNIMVYPNPTHDFLNISINSDSIYIESCVLINSIGQQIILGNDKLDVSKIEHGYYILKIITNKDIYRKSISIF